MSSQTPSDLTESITFWAAIVAIGWTVCASVSWWINIQIIETWNDFAFVGLIISILVFIGSSFCCFAIGLDIVKKFPFWRAGNLSHHLIPLGVGLFFFLVTPGPEADSTRVAAIKTLQLGIEVYILVYFLSYILLSKRLKIPLQIIHWMAPIFSIITIAWLYLE